MGIDLSKMQQKQASLDGNGGDNKFWKPEHGTQDIRVICPSDGDPFKEFHFHYLEANGRRKSLLCPKRNFGDNCPVCDFASLLWRDSVTNNDENGKKAAKGLFVKQRYFSPVLVRGQEDTGIRAWGYGITAYKKLLSLVLNPEYGDITDVDEGTDLVITYEKTSGKTWPTTDISPRRHTSALCNEAIGGSERCAELLESMPDFSNLFDRSTTQDAQNVLDEFLADEDSAGDDRVHYNSQPVSEIDEAYKQLMNAK